MGQAFSGPHAFEFFGFTPKATALLQAQPFLLIILLLCLVFCLGLGLLAWYIHSVTNRVYAKPKAPTEKKKAGLLGMMRR